ncbi:25S rRNA (cytosine-C(5))-methyltransferase NSUN5 isoform X2 [Apium graveolens]|uniref:25S rRNA (cytosine-C(5))-methyltransferase NSUN5 isoform X2 n=1 Tax=Apium graveolens TaxID=4045 RepID=UPI003D7BF336
MPPTTNNSKPKKTARLSNAEKSAFFGRREAAKVLTSVLDGDARRQAVGSIKALVFKPSVRNKKATFALVCQTLKCLPYIKEILESSVILNSKWKKQEALMYLITYDILFGQNVALVGDAEKFLLHKKDALLSALAHILVKNRAKNVKDLMALRQDVSKPRYVRVNTLKLDTKTASKVLRKRHKVQKDDLVPDLLVLPPGTDLHNHELVKNGSVLLQGKASSMVGVALDPKPGWEVLDACSAPGNKTVHLAALMRGEGKIIACELNKERVKLLECTIKQTGATNVEVLHEDFLKLSPVDPSYSKVRAILVDPSCSGSGTAVDRLDHLLPSYQTGHVDPGEMQRLRRLATFQKMALEHALSSEHLLRADPVEDKEGFFIALFERSIHDLESHQEREIGNSHNAVVPCKTSERNVEAVNKSRSRSSCFFPSLSLKMSRVLLNPYFDVRKNKYQN